MLTFVFYFILVCLQLNLTVSFKGVHYHVELALFFCTKKTYEEQFTNFRANFNENPSMRAIPKLLRARASEHSSKFCEQIEQRPNFAST